MSPTFIAITSSLGSFLAGICAALALIANFFQVRNNRISETAKRIRANAQIAAAALDTIESAIKSNSTLHNAGHTLSKSFVKWLPKTLEEGFDFERFRVYLPTIIAEATDSNKSLRHIEKLTSDHQKTMTHLASDVPVMALISANTAEVISGAIGFESYRRNTSDEALRQVIRSVMTSILDPRLTNVPTDVHFTMAFTMRIVEDYTIYFEKVLQFQEVFLRTLSVAISRMPDRKVVKLQKVSADVQSRRLVGVYEALLKAFEPHIDRSGKEELQSLLKNFIEVYEDAEYTEEEATNIVDAPLGKV